MKKSIFIFFLISGLIGNSQNFKDSIGFKATYKFTYQKDSMNIDSRQDEIMWLFIGDQSSLFLSKPRAMKDSLDINSNLASIGSDPWKQNLSKTKTDFNFKIYKDRKKDKVYHSIAIMDDKLFYSEPLVLSNWIIQDESKMISGYKTQKATRNFAGRDYTAWFTSEIPIPDGPYKFSGLPGLILEIKDSRNHYNFEFIGFEKVSPKLPLAILPQEFQETTKIKLNDIQRKYQEDPIGYMNNYVGNGGAKITITINDGRSKQQYLKERKEKLAKFNNTIELK
ncbi:GLPGLI family protein [Christiangramia sp. SM2212]|uniref:GLPGLI family protein n=1 Tax=Christiangramia sediminicola TaxID=3073267 RepID=A0ABU1EL13_9FLAO|nr:GLPGLI family protein [Christiangramia sp. SM2212]MDR5589061.1 GLPGLI family protein [Christiangramia sp. SM2212]